jgi:hypothetical protein
MHFKDFFIADVPKIDFIAALLCGKHETINPEV